MAHIGNGMGPVCVTGASGYIGSHVVKNLVEHGYTVRACVREKNRADKVAHLLALNGAGLGNVELHEADMMVDRSYDKVFVGCSAVFHVAADIGTDPSYGKIDPQRMYKGLFEATQNVLDSIERSGSVKRLIYTSSCAAVMGPAPDGYIFTEADWSGAGGRELLEKKWMIPKTGKTAWTVEANAYAKGKLDCEVMTYGWGKEKGVDVITCCPNHVIGPLLCAAHDTIWQHRLGEIFAGKYSLDQLWGITDVRDVADSQRRMAESPIATNSSRYILSSPSDRSGWVTAREMVKKLNMLYPNSTNNIGGPKPMTPDRNTGRGTSELAEKELGLRCHIVNDTIKDTIDSLERLGCIKKIVDRMEERAKAEAAGKPIAVRMPQRPSEAKL